jgi:Xaa-Pro aminopeptidase
VQVGTGDVGSRSDLIGAAADVLAQEGIDSGRVGVTGLHSVLPVADFQTLRDALPRVEFVDADPLLAGLKLLKEDEEITEIRRTVAIADAGFTAARSLTRPGVTDSEIFGAIREVVSSRGARDALVFVSALPYFLSWPQGEALREGHLLTIFIEIVGPTGYWVECGGLLAIGRPEPEQLQVAEASLEAARRAETRLRPGATAGDVAREIDAVVAEHHLRAGLWHGHGVGVDHDAPVITQSDDTPLAAGMVIAVHPNFATADERFGASAVDTYLITEDAPERLSAIPQQILQAEREGQ